MTPFRTAAVALVSMVALGSVTTAPTAFADNHKPAPCAQQTAQLNRAEAKLADLTAKFAAHPTQKNLKAKKAQAKRVAHDTAALAACVAAQTS